MVIRKYMEDIGNDPNYFALRPFVRVLDRWGILCEKG